MAVNKSVFEQLGGFDEAFPFPHLEDVDFKERVIAEGCKIKFVDRAIVDHPPRKYHTFKKLALTHESEIYFFAKKRQAISLYTMCKMVAMVKARTIRKHLSHPDTFVYFLSSVYDLCYIVFNFGVWKKKYKLHSTK
jgi:GT2 family glycosyltransferase